VQHPRPAWPGDLLYLLVAYTLALPSVLLADRMGSSAEVVAVLKLLCILAFAWHALALIRKRHAASRSRLALAASAGLLWAAVLAMFLYEAVALSPFSLEEAVASAYDTRQTLLQSLGPRGVEIALASLAALALACCAAAWALYRVLPQRAQRLAIGPRGAAACVGLLFFFGGGDLKFVADQLLIYPKTGWAQRYLPPPLIPDYSTVRIRPGDSVFIVQLESVSSDALFERARDGVPSRVRIPQPGLETVVKEGGGVLFPLFWANGTRTNRAWESILCAASGNVGEALAYRTERLLNRTCLPEQMANAGYATVFFYSYFETQFFNFGGFIRKAGFRQVQYGSALMAEGDRRHNWAYDDCVFYNRAFDQLERRKGERMLAYFEVGMNHVPYDEQKYPEAHPFRAPKSVFEHYVNSVSEQDHCLLEFWKRFRRLGRDDVHLFVLPDHSVYTTGIPNEPDSLYATWLVYVPPARRAREFTPRTVDSPVPSQAQLVPTILELLGADPLPGSFAFALRGDAVPPYYDNCHMMGRHGVSLVVRRKSERAEYRLYSGETVLPDGSVVKSDLSSFQERFACR
jgi:hypothetical protein